MDPWRVNEAADVKPKESVDESSDKVSGFEDNFNAAEGHQIEKLSDSEQYLSKLESKLRRMKNDPDVLGQIRARREECVERLLASGADLAPTPDFALDESISGGHQQAVLRLLNPEQPLTVGETVHLVKHDQLEAAPATADEREDAQSSESSSSR